MVSFKFYMSSFRKLKLGTIWSQFGFWFSNFLRLRFVFHKKTNVNFSLFGRITIEYMHHRKRKIIIEQLDGSNAFNYFSFENVLLFFLLLFVKVSHRVRFFKEIRKKKLTKKFIVTEEAVFYLLILSQTWVFLDMYNNSISIRFVHSFAGAFELPMTYFVSNPSPYFFSSIPKSELPNCFSIHFSPQLPESNIKFGRLSIWDDIIWK